MQISTVNVGTAVRRKIHAKGTSLRIGSIEEIAS